MVHEAMNRIFSSIDSFKTLHQKYKYWLVDTGKPTHIPIKFSSQMKYVFGPIGIKLVFVSTTLLKDAKLQ